MVRFGVNMPNFGDYGDPGVLVDIARDAEAAGWDGFFLWDHVQFGRTSDVPVVDPWVALAAVAQATERLVLGPMVTPVPRRRPWKLAKETATLDVLAGGRTVFGVGLGAPPDADFADLGEEADARTRAAMLDEGLGLIDRFWTGEAVTHDGDHYRADEVRLLPRPVQRPRIPVWVAGFWPNKRPFRRAARWDGVFPIVWSDDGWTRMTPGVLAEIVGYVQEHREGDGPFDVVLADLTPPDPDEAGEELAPLAEAGLTWWQETLGMPDRPLEYYRERVRAGPPRL